MSATHTRTHTYTDVARVAYVGMPRGARGVAEVEVLRVTATGWSVRPLAHQVRHSPTGFGWGYGGSGPADLALSLLTDALGDTARCQTCEGIGTTSFAGAGDDWGGSDWREVPDSTEAGSRCTGCWGTGLSGLVESGYQPLKWALVAALPEREPFLITRERVLVAAAITELDEGLS